MLRRRGVQWLLHVAASLDIRDGLTQRERYLLSARPPTLSVGFLASLSEGDGCSPRVQWVREERLSRGAGRVVSVSPYRAKYPALLSCQASPNPSGRTHGVAAPATLNPRMCPATRAFKAAHGFCEIRGFGIC